MDCTRRQQTAPADIWAEYRRDQGVGRDQERYVEPADGEAMRRVELADGDAFTRTHTMRKLADGHRVLHIYDAQAPAHTL
jgi:hypothetical protein